MYKPIKTVNDNIIFAYDEAQHVVLGKDFTISVCPFLYCSYEKFECFPNIRITINKVPGFLDEGGVLKGIALKINTPEYHFDSEFCSKFTREEKDKFILYIKEHWKDIIVEANGLFYVGGKDHLPTDKPLKGWTDLPEDYPMPDYSILETEEDDE